jgi:hypothetical protein
MSEDERCLQSTIGCHEYFDVLFRVITDVRTCYVSMDPVKSIRCISHVSCNICRKLYHFFHIANHGTVVTSLQIMDRHV